MKLMLIDDEYYALQGLKIEIDKMPQIEIVGMFQSGQQALEQVKSLCPDVVLLDIDMPQMNGIECYRRLIEMDDRLNIIFVTAYDNYAVQAFELNAVDYLLKPVQRQRLEKALSRVTGASSYKESEKNIRINCFKHFEVIFEGQVINTGWRTKKAEELLAYLICEKGRFVSKERIAEDLWPELDGDKSIANLYLAFYYLKKQEKLRNVSFPIESERGRMRILYENLDCDLKIFDQGVTAENGITKNNVEAVQEALSTYTGQLLEDHYYHWLTWHQNQHQIAYDRLVEKLKIYQLKPDE